MNYIKIYIFNTNIRINAPLAPVIVKTDLKLSLSFERIASKTSKKVLKKVSRRNYVEKMWNLDKNETLEGGNHAE